MAGSPSPNPWRTPIFEALRNGFRFTLWFAFALNVLMFATFCVIWVGHFLYHTWTYFRRTWFTGEW